ncbi:MAG: hypothetical protein EPO26_16840 [Chloroflexota bacterium]|nr:MAG: hypothetical protein EPO26_16840 [Chloroflexota bacterium]
MQSTFPYQVRCKNRRVAGDWENLAASYDNAARACFDWLATNADTVESDRCYPLKGREFERRGIWQYKISDGGRIWFTRIPDSPAVVIIEVHTGHPKETEPGHGRG